MSRTNTFRRKLIGLGAAALLSIGTVPALAGGGKAIGNVAGELTERFNKAADPKVPRAEPTPKLDLKPPERVPEPSPTWSPGRVDATPPNLSKPDPSAVDTFNRNAAEALRNTFNRVQRLLD